MAQSEKELIIRDLYIMNTFYKNKEEYDEVLSNKNLKINKAEIDILGYPYEIESAKDIEDIFVKNGDRFNDDFGKNKPNEYVAELDKNICSLWKILITILIGFSIAFSCIYFIIKYCLFIFGGAEVGEVVGVLIIILIALVGLLAFITGINDLISREKKLKEYAEAQKKEEEQNKKIKVWLCEQNLIVENRKKVVNELYKKEINTCIKQYFSQIEEYNKIKDEHICKVEGIIASIENVKKNSLVPVYYLNDSEAVEKMLFFMLNKRADTIKELVNLYETAKWQDSVLEQLQITNNNLIEQNYALIDATLKVDESINRVVYDMQNTSFTTTSYGILI